MWTTDLNGPDRRRAGRSVQSGRTSFFPVPVLLVRTSATGRKITFSPSDSASARQWPTASAGRRDSASIQDNNYSILIEAGHLM